MEWFWYIIASIGAGVGTGLAGLSAATVMVPMLIVLCPSFSGETGAYQATAVALASDILGSAVTTYTYGKNKNIDLKRSWLIMTCILVMCTVGSYVAFIAGNTVLGGFTLFLTFCIGIRFLVKPDTTRKKSYRERFEIWMERSCAFARLRYSDWLWHRLCRHWRRYDDADRFHGVLRHGAENGGRNEYVYNDLYGADRIGRSYHDTPCHRV